MSVYERLQERYEAEEVPWDAELPPPEVIELVETLTPGRALDLGSGYGRAAIYLGQQGWQVDGVDFILQAVAEARRRAEAAGVQERVHFHLGEVTAMPYLSGPYDFALDVGCFHALTEEEQRAYQSELVRLLRDEAIYLLFAHLRGEEDEPEEDDTPRWVEPETIEAIFADAFVLEKSVHGVTQVEDKPPWRSAWFWFRRK